MLKNICLCALLLGLAFLAYHNAFQHEFLLDDYVNLLAPDNISRVPTPQLFQQEYRGYYRPIPFTFLKLVMGLAGTNSFGYHLYNFFLFWIQAVMFFVIVRALGFSRATAFVASALFAVHPINAMLVNYKTASNFSIYAIFMLLGCWMFLLYLNNNRWIFSFLSLMCYIAAVFSHEMAIMLPAYLILILRYSGRTLGRREGVLGLGFLVACVGFVLYRIAIHDASSQIQLLPGTIPALSSVATVTKLSFWYLSKLILPFNIIFIWDERVVSGLEKFFYCAVFLGVVAASVTAFLRYPRSIWGLALNFLVAGFLPLAFAAFTYTANMKTAIIEPQWFTVGSLGFFLFVGVLVTKIRARLPPVAWGFTAGATFLALIALTYSGNPEWQTSQRYCLYWLEHNALNGTPWNALAKDFIKDHDRGLNADFYPSCQEPALLGMAHHITNSAQKAEDFLHLALIKNNRCGWAYYGKAMLYEELALYQEAGIMAEAGRNVDPTAYPLYRFMRSAFLNQHEKSTFREMDAYLRNHNLWPSVFDESAKEY